MKGFIAILAVVLVVASPCFGAKMPMMEVPPDVIQFEHFVQDFENNEIHLAPTNMLFRGNFPLAFQKEKEIQRLKRQAPAEPTEPGLTVDVSDDDLMIKHYVQNEINRIFSCYQRLRCGYTRGQAEQECKWLEQSSLYHQIMKVLGIKNYPKKFPTSAPQQPQQQQQQQHQGPTGQVSSSTSQRGQNSDAAINPAHRNLQNGIRYGGARPGQYLQSAYNSRNRRAYDSFFTGQQLAPIEGAAAT